MLSKLPKILCGALALAVLLVVGVQLYVAYGKPYTLETVVSLEVQESFDVKGIVSREETVLDSRKSGAVDYLIHNGDKVAKNSVVAQMYPNEEDISNMSKVAQLEAELKTVQESQALGAAAGTQAASLTRQINSVNGEYVGALQGPEFGGRCELKLCLLSAFNRSQIVFENVSDFNARIDELKNEIAALRQKSGQSVSSVTAPVSGYFVNSADGFETLTNLDKAGQLTEQQIEEFFTMKKPEADETLTGKIITNAKWRYTAIVDASKAVLLKEGKKYNLLFQSAADEMVATEVISNSYNASQPTAVVVFETDRLSEKLVKLRLEEAQVVMQTHEGIKIPKSALHIVEGEDGPEKGVYIKYGQIMKFKLVDIIYENEEYFVSEDKETELERSKYVRIYDDVIVKGSDLYDGKPLS